MTSDEIVKDFYRAVDRRLEIVIAKEAEKRGLRVLSTRMQIEYDFGRGVREGVSLEIRRSED
jgi:hypothetical protein